MMIVVSLFELAGVGMIPLFVAILADPEPLLANEWLQPVLLQMGIDSFESLFLAGSLMLILVFVVKNAITSVYYYLEGRYAWSRYGTITGELFRRYMSAPYTFHLYRNSAEVIRNITEEGRFMIMNLFLPIIRLAMNTLVTSVLLTLLFIVEPIITLVAILIIGGAGGAILYLLKTRFSFYGQDAHEARLGLIRSTSEGIGGFKDIRILRRESWFVQKLERFLNRYVRSQIYWYTAYNSNKPVTETIAVAGMLSIAIILYLQSGSLEGILTLLALFAAATIRLLPALREIVRDINQIQYYKVTVDPIYRDYHALAQSGVGSKEYFTAGSNEQERVQPLQKEIRFDNVSYQYPRDDADAKGSGTGHAGHFAVQNINLSIRRGEVVSVSGATGSGKTTLIDLLLGLLDPVEGEVLFDDCPRDEYLAASGNQIGYIPQFIFLMDESLKRNIAFGLADDEINEDRIWEVIRIAQLEEVVAKLDHGIETGVGEQGTRLSGGERQRIGIARALYHDPDIMIMDEATSALDSHTENELIRAVEQIRKDKTLIIISHRTPILEICNTIYFIQNGKITDSGTLDELIARNLEFKEMARVF